MPTVIMRKPDAKGMRVDVVFRDREDAENAWMYRNRDFGSNETDYRCEAKGYKLHQCRCILNDVVILAAKEYVKLDPLDEPSCTR